MRRHPANGHDDRGGPVRPPPRGVDHSRPDRPGPGSRSRGGGCGAGPAEATRERRPGRAPEESPPPPVSTHLASPRRPTAPAPAGSEPAPRPAPAARTSGPLWAPGGPPPRWPRGPWCGHTHSWGPFWTCRPRAWTEAAGALTLTVPLFCLFLILVVRGHPVSPSWIRLEGGALSCFPCQGSRGGGGGGF